MATQTMTALARVEQETAKPLARIEDVRAVIERVRGQVHMLCPVTQLDYIPPHHQISLRTVLLDPARDCYRGKAFCDEDEVAPKKEGILKILSAAGAAVKLDRLDDRSKNYYWEVKATIVVKEFDGTEVPMEATKALDLNDGTPDALAAMGSSNSKQSLAVARQHGLSLCETKALLRACRAKFQIFQKYKRAELGKPFMFPKLVAAPDMSDPDVKKAFLESVFPKAAENRLYGGEPDTKGPVHELPASSVRALPAAADTRPATATGSPTKSSPTQSQAAADQADDADFDVPEDPRKGEDVIVVCGCPCSCQVELTPAIATASVERMGTPRCVRCVPGKRFDNAKHADLRDLQLPKLGPMSGEEAGRRADAARAGSAR